MPQAPPVRGRWLLPIGGPRRVLAQSWGVQRGDSEASCREPERPGRGGRSSLGCGCGSPDAEDPSLSVSATGADTWAGLRPRVRLQKAKRLRASKHLQGNARPAPRCATLTLLLSCPYPTSYIVSL